MAKLPKVFTEKGIGLLNQAVDSRETAAKFVSVY